MCAKVPQCLSSNQGFLTFLLGRYTFLSSRSYFPHPSQKSFEQSKEMTFDRRLANITALVVRRSYCSSSQNLVKKAMHEITVNSQS